MMQAPQQHPAITPRRGRGRAGPPKRACAPLLVYFLKEQRQRIEEACAAIGRTMSDVVREAVMDKVREIETGIERDKEIKRNALEQERTFVPRPASKSKGLGLKKKRISPENDLPAEAFMEPTPTVIVQTAAPVAKNSAVEDLAAWVIAAKADRFEKERRARTALEVLRTGSPNATDFAEKKDALDKLLSNDPQERSKPSSWLTRR